MIKKILNFLKFYSSVLCRLIVLVFKKNRTLSKSHFEYIASPHSEDDFLILDFKFRNALFYKINETKYLYDGCKIIFLKKYNYKISFEAIGYQGTYKEDFFIEPTIKTNFSKLKTKSQNLNFDFKAQEKTNTINLKKTINSIGIELNQNSVQIKKQNITIKFNSFNQNDYL
jgi:hypothetical protein